METTFQKACKAAGRSWLSLAEVAALPVSKADLAHEAAEARESAARAYAKGDKARELLNSCLPNPAFVRAWAKDFEVQK